MVGKCGFYNQVAQIRYPVHHRPQGVVNMGVATKHQTPLPAVKMVAHRRNSVNGRSRGNFASLQIDHLSHRDRTVAHHRLIAVINLTEIRPDFPVKNMLFEYFQGGGGGIYGHRLAAHSRDAVQQQGQTTDVIHMRMRDENMINSAQFGQAELTHARPRIDQDVMINHERSGAQTATDPATTPQYSKFHA